MGRFFSNLQPEAPQLQTLRNHDHKLILIGFRAIRKEGAETVHPIGRLLSAVCVYVGLSNHREIAAIRTVYVTQDDPWVVQDVRVFRESGCVPMTILEKSASGGNAATAREEG